MKKLLAVMAILLFAGAKYVPTRPYFTPFPWQKGALMPELVIKYFGVYNAFVPESTDVMNIGHADFYWDTLYARYLKGTAERADTSTVSLDSYWERQGNLLYPKTITDSVGIGGSVPTQRLDVWGNAKIRSGNIYMNKVRISDNVGWTNVMNFYQPGLTDLTMQYIFGADSLGWKTRTKDVYLYVLGAGGENARVRLAYKDGHGEVASDSGDLVLTYQYNTVSQVVRPWDNHKGRLGSSSYYWQSIYVDTIFLSEALVFGGITIDSLTKGTNDSLIFWSGSDSWGIKKR